MMFGYYWHSGEMGSRKVLDDVRQPRCGVHPGIPFMYVGKVGQRRRYLCPFYKCNKQGEEISKLVIDEEVETREDPLIRRKKIELQRVEEMGLFLSFVAASGLPLDQGSEANMDPPYADIRCTIAGRPHSFELAEVINEIVAARLSPKRKTKDGGFSYSQEQSFLQILSTKVSKLYENDAGPVDLVLHFDLRWGSEKAMIDQIKKHTRRLMLLTTDGPFYRVWIFDHFAKKIVWVGPEKWHS
jgi:hypothetical protein